MKNIRHTLSLLHDKIDALRLENRVLCAQIVELKQENAALRIENTQLKSEVTRLTHLVGTLEEKTRQSSRTSSMAPSADLKKKKRVTPPERRSGKKRGAQPGHVGKARPLASKDSITHSVEIAPPSRCDCGGKVKKNRRKPWRRQQIEIPPITPIISEYLCYSGTCLSCKKCHRASLPSGVGSQLLGPRFLAFIADLATNFRMSKAQIVLFVRRYFNVNISVGCISESEGRVTEALHTKYEAISETIATSSHAHIDETSYRQSYKQGWAWLGLSQYATLFRILNSRSRTAMRTILPDRFTGHITSDRYGAYHVFDPERRQICWAHLRRDFFKWAQSTDTKAQKLGKILVEATGHLFSYLHTMRKDQLPNRALIALFRTFFHDLLVEVSALETRMQFARSAKRILALEKSMWNFADIPGRDPTNNAAERALRPLVIQRKLSGGTRSERGTHYIEVMFSIIATCKQNAQDSYQTTLESIANSLQSNNALPIYGTKQSQYAS
jgi:transposase